MNKLPDQKTLIENREWDYLLILDACRFDLFEKFYGKYLTGDLKRCQSRGSNTGEWLAKTFNDYHDVTYFSTNPHINSIGLSLSECADYEYQWKATEHFAEIVDLWDFAWNDELNGVHPKEVNKAVLSANERGRRKIVHYMQPHSPYLSFARARGLGWFGEMRKAMNMEDQDNISNTRGYDEISNLKSQIMNKLRDFFGENSLIERETFWKIKKLLAFPPETGMEAGWRSGDRYRFYKADLKVVLDYVSRLVRRVEGKVVVSADHGEAFGEDRVWGHPAETGIGTLRQVPWLEIDKD